MFVNCIRCFGVFYGVFGGCRVFVVPGVMSVCRCLFFFNMDLFVFVVQVVLVCSRMHKWCFLRFLRFLYVFYDGCLYVFLDICTCSRIFVRVLGHEYVF